MGQGQPFEIGHDVSLENIEGLSTQAEYLPNFST